MADSQLEHVMDDFLVTNLKLEESWQVKNAAGNWVASQGFVLEEGNYYRVGLRANNTGTETYVKNVDIRAWRDYPGGRVVLYTDDTYNQPTSFSQGLFPPTLAPGQSTPFHWAYFRVENGFEGFPQQDIVIGVGVYAEIVPQAHYWRNIRAFLKE